MADDVPMGALDTDWRDREADEALRLQQSDDAAKKASGRSWYDTVNDVAHFPHRMVSALMTPTEGSARVGNNPAAFGTQSPGEIGENPDTYVSPLVKNTMSAIGGVAKSGYDVASGATPLMDPNTGRTNEKAVQGVFDAASLAGGGSVAGTAARAMNNPGLDLRVLGKQLASDSSKAGAPIAVAEHAPPFYSGLERAVAEHPQEVAAANQWPGILNNKPGVKQAEIEATGADKFLAGKGNEPVTKQDLLSHLENNKVQIGEVSKQHMPESWDQLPGDKRHEVADKFVDITGRSPQRDDLPAWYDQIAEHSRNGNETALDSLFNPPRFADYQLPGGENYREKLLTLPEKQLENPKTGEQVARAYGRDWEKVAPYEREGFQADADRQNAAARNSYKSKHWPDDPNTLLHLRMNERDVSGNGFTVRNQVSGRTSQTFPGQAEAQAYIEKLPENLQRQVNIVPAKDTKPALHLEELQSDWHQAGRKQGYNVPPQKGVVKPQESLFGPGRESWKVEWPDGTFSGGYSREAAEHVAANPPASRGGVPDAPFKQTSAWMGLGLKRALHEAAETGKERLSWTPGEAQADRYDLSKKISRIAYDADEGKLIAYDKGFKQVMSEPVDEPTAAAFEPHIGKEPAQKLEQAVKAAQYDREQWQPYQDEETGRWHISDPNGEPLYDHGGREARFRSEADANEHIDQMLQEERQREGAGHTAEISGLDLKVGGEGMKAFYDKMIPDYLNKIGKPHGVQVKEGRIGGEVRIYDNEGKPGMQFPSMQAAQQWLKRDPDRAQFWTPRESAPSVHYMDIPPSLRQQLLTKGMPLFEDSSAGAGIAAAEHLPAGIGHNSGVTTPMETAAERALTVNDILHPDTPAAKPNSRNVEDIAADLDKRGQAALKKLGVNGGQITEPNPKHDEIISRAMASEIKSAMNRGGNTAHDWYTQKVKEAMDTASELHPELKTDPNARMAFTAALAITSQGETVTSNVRLANQVYNHFKQTGRFPTDVAADKQIMMNSSLGKLNELISAMGPDGAREFLEKEFTVKELNKMGYKISGENVDTKVHGSAILGPKIGQGFYQNLNGNYNPVTMDLWFMRAWNRLTGNLVGNREFMPKATERLSNALQAEGLPVPKTAKAMRKVADQIVETHEQDYKANRALYKSKEKTKSEKTLAAERYQVNDTGINEQPTGGAHRTWMRGHVARARELLAEQGIHVTPADLQAIWWYPEKELYAKLGGRDAEKINTDYSSAFRELVNKLKGEGDGNITQRPAPAGDVPTAGGSGLRAGADDAAGNARRGRRGAEGNGQAAAQPEEVGFGALDTRAP